MYILCKYEYRYNFNELNLFFRILITIRTSLIILVCYNFFSGINKSTNLILCDYNPSLSLLDCTYAIVRNTLPLAELHMKVFS